MVQAAAAEDFDPVRIRPFVKVGDEAERTDEAADPADPHADEPAEGAQDSEVAERTSPLGDGGAPAPPVGRHDTAPSLLDEHPPAGSAQEDQRRRRRMALAAGAAAVVLVAGGLIVALFSYQAPSRDGALPDDVRGALPERTSDDDASSAAPSGTASSAQPSGTPATSPGATPSESRATPTGTDSPTRTPSNSGATGTAVPGPTQSGPQDPVLGFGDKGPEVTELQLRLRETGFYNGDIDGDYDREVESAVRLYQVTRVVLADESGVYGKVTRASLESETSEP